MIDDQELVDMLGIDVAETMARESAIMTATLMGPCPSCGAEPTIELLGSEFDHQIVVEHADECSAQIEGGQV